MLAEEFQVSDARETKSLNAERQEWIFAQEASVNTTELRG